MARLTRNHRTVRGGSWASHRDLARCSSRSWSFPGLWLPHLGVRVSFRLMRNQR